MGEIARLKRFTTIILLLSLVIIGTERLLFVGREINIQLPPSINLSLFILSIVAIWSVIVSAIVLLVLFIMQKMPLFKHLK